jgi:Zn-dependent protease
MDASPLFAGAIQLLLLLLSISAHEAAHTWMADRCGDATGRLAGRLTLNPLVHIDLFGSIVVPLVLIGFKMPVVFGWGRPTFVMSKNLRRRGRDDALVAAAGPAVNLILMVLAAGALVAAVAATGVAGWRSALVALSFGDWPAADPRAMPAAFPLMFTLARLVSINAVLGLFNLIPLPPFDGGRMLYYLLPPALAARMASLPGYGLMIAIAVFASTVLVLLMLMWSALMLGIFLYM